MAGTKADKRRQKRGVGPVADLRATANGCNIPPKALKSLALLMEYTQGLTQDKRTEFLRFSRG